MEAKDLGDGTDVHPRPSALSPTYNPAESSMRARHLPLILAGCLAAATAVAQPALVCPTAPAGRPCDTYHFHVQMYRVDTKQWVEVFGVNQFASAVACDRARDLHIANNGKAIDY